MDTLRGFEEDRVEADYHDEADMSVDDNSDFDIGTDERRMHVRAYNHWVSLLGGRAYPSIEDLDPENIADFGPHSVLLDFTGGIENPAVRFLGQALRDECALDASITHIAQVPSRLLLSRLTDHYLQIIANRAPIGFEAEFVGTRGHNTLYRGILMPFSSDEDTIDFIYGVINWKEMVDEATQAALTAEIAEAVRTAPRAVAAPSAWASGPSADLCDGDDETGFGLSVEAVGAMVGGALALADQLSLAQQSAAAVRAADTRSRAALYRALGRAYDFAGAADADPVGYTALLAAASLSVQARAPMTPIVKLVFGADYDKTRLTEFAAVLTHARRANVPMGALGDFLEMADGGIKGIVAAERALKRPVKADDGAAARMARLDAMPSLAQIALPVEAVKGDYVVLVARRDADGGFDVVASMGAQELAATRLLKSLGR